MKTSVRKAAAIITAAATSVGAFAFAAPLAFADMNSSSITITSTNSGQIDNTTSARASTGGNWAGGSRGGSGGYGGDVQSLDGDNNNGGATAGQGGNGGNAGLGGFVETGNASADAGTMNSLNTTAVDLDLGGNNMNSSSMDVVTDNDSDTNSIDNTTRANARTGGNDASGSRGGRGGGGGDIDAGSSGNNNNGSATAGNGGTGGAGGAGGEVHTGTATSDSGVFNVLNTTLVRVRL